MAGIELKEVTRETIKDLVVDAKNKSKDKKTHIRQELMRTHPGIEALTVRRNGQVYNALDYLMEDVESYGEE